MVWYQLNPKSFSELFLILHSFLCSILVKNPPPAPGSLFLGVAIRSASGRDLTRVLKPNSISGKPTSRVQPAIFKNQFGGSNCLLSLPVFWSLDFVTFFKR